MGRGASLGAARARARGGPAEDAGVRRVARSLRAEAVFDPSDTCLVRSLVTYLLESLFSGALSVAGTVLGPGGARAAVRNRTHSR